MSGLSSREAAPKVINHTSNGLGSYVHPLPNEKKKQKPANTKKPPKLCMPDSEMHGLMSMFWGNSMNKGSPDANDWKWWNFCQEVLGLEGATCKSYWKNCLHKHADTIEKFTTYAIVEASNGKVYKVPVMKKSGMLFMLSQEIKGLWPESARNTQAARILQQFIAEDNATDEQQPVSVHEAHTNEEQAPDDTVMNDIGPESDIEEFSTAGASSAPMKEV